ncbi:hypothetical protein NQ317_003874 [Molorchus minor]|uniref:FERM domain-containing protein n=1 Tax=Molorchus minor TaxID=1323400 RepID=A0ABQ9JD27_9CUCU|nr:hypothetical protein NQ317_003874 [Molorchus minor]
MDLIILRGMPENKKMAVDSEIMNKNKSSTNVRSSGNTTTFITMLDGTVLEVHIDRKAKGKELLDKICEAINLIEKDYFGLVYADRHDPRNWLDLDKRISKFIKVEPWRFSFEVKFYPPILHSCKKILPDTNYVFRFEMIF